MPNASQVQEVVQRSRAEIDEQEEPKTEEATVADRGGRKCLSTGAQCSRGRDCCSGHCLIGAGFCFPAGGFSLQEDNQAREAVQQSGEEIDEQNEPETEEATVA